MASEEGVIADGEAVAPQRGVLQRWAGEASGALAATLIAIPQAMSLGVLAFAALGPTFAAFGVACALFASVLGNLVAAAIPAAAGNVLGARSSATVIFAGIIAAFAAHPLLQNATAPNVPWVLALAFATVLIAGALQIALAVLGVGRAARYVPHPVAAGFMNGIALIILLSQFSPALGGPAGWSSTDMLHNLDAVRPGAIATTAGCLATIFLVRRFLPRIPEALCGLLVAIGVHYAIASVAPASVGPTVGPLPAFDAMPNELRAMIDFPWTADPQTWLALVLPNAALLASVAALDGLLAAVAADSATHTRHDGRRLLIGQGIAGLLAGAFGAIPPLANAHSRVASVKSGGSSPAATFLHAIFVLAAILILAPQIALVPVAALAGVMIYIAYSLIDRWSSGLMGRLGRGHHRNEIALNVAIVLGVALALPLVNVMTAFAIGVSATVVLLLAKLSRSPVRKVIDGSLRTSLKFRAPDARAALLQLGRTIRIVELEGALFFGTAEGLRACVEALPRDVRYLILDFRRVHEIDASGAHVLQVVSDLAQRRGARVLLSHVQEDETHGAYLHALGMSAAVPPGLWFRDLDRAMEWAEDELLQAERFQDAPELLLGRMSLFAGMGEEELPVVAAALERRELKHGEIVFQEGDAGDRLYLIARGFVSIKVKLADDVRAVRLATFSPGVFFGEIAMIEGRSRSSDAFAKGDHVVLYSLTARRFESLVREHPGIGLALNRNLARELAGRVRATSQAWRALE